MIFPLFLLLLLSRFPFLCDSSFFHLARSILSSRKDATIGWDGMRALCNTTPDCLPLAAGGEVGCVTRCMSPRCSKRAHGVNGLEPGEVAPRDHSSNFRKCLRASERPLKLAGLWPPRLNEDGNALKDTDEKDDQVYFALPPLVVVVQEIPDSNSDSAATTPTPTNSPLLVITGQDL